MAVGARSEHPNEGLRSEVARELVRLWAASDPEAALRGCGRAALQLERLLVEIERDMVRLCERSAPAVGFGLGLAVQRRTGGAVALRWRTAEGRIRSAAAVERIVASLPASGRRRFEAMDARVRWLNASERIVRHARRVMRELYTEGRRTYSL